MSASGNLRTGGQILIDQLRIHGADLAFGVPGESYLAALDALYDAPDLRYVICRQEGGAAMMADAYGKLTGRPGICMVTRAPGAANASVGLHIAAQDSTPMILLIGQVGRAMLGREAFQEIDYRRMFGHVAKWVAEIEDPARIPEFVARAYTTATAGRPGPVVLALPEDMLRARAAADDARPTRPSPAHPGPEAMARLREMLAAAERPFAIVGGSGWTPEAVADFQAFAGANRLPVGASFRRQDRFDNTHPCYAGHVGINPDPRLKARLDAADLLLAVGTRLGEATTGGYTLFNVPRPRQRMIHVHPGAEELGQVYQADLPINAGMAPFAAAARALRPIDPAPWADQSEAAHREYLESLAAPTIPGALQMGEVMAHLRAALPPETIIANGAGNYSVWPNGFYQHSAFPTQLGPTSGTMGYGTPAAVAAKLVYPDRPVIAFAGDGCFMMNGQELATAAQYSLAIVVLVVNNGMYGTIRMHQERAYPTRTLGTDLANPDFAALARAYGAHGETVTRTEEFAPAFERAMGAGRPALIDLRVDPEAITPRISLSDLRDRALAATAAAD